MLITGFSEMSRSTWLTAVGIATVGLTTVGMTTVDQISCIAFEVMSSSDDDEKKRDVALGVSFAVAFVVGGLLALLAAILLFRYIARRVCVCFQKPPQKI